MSVILDLDNPKVQSQIADKLYGMDKLELTITNARLLGGLDFTPAGTGSNFSFEVLRQLDYTVQDYNVGGKPVVNTYGDFLFLRYDVVLSEQKKLGPISQEKVDANSKVKGGIDAIVNAVVREFQSDFKKERYETFFKQAIEVANAFDLINPDYSQMINIGLTAGVISDTAVEVAGKYRDGINVLMNIDNSLIDETFEDDLIGYWGLPFSAKMSDPELNLFTLKDGLYVDGIKALPRVFDTEFVRWNKVQRGGNLDATVPYMLEAILMIRGATGAPERLIDIITTPLENDPNTMIRGTSIRGWAQYGVFTIAPEGIIAFYTGATTDIPVPTFPFEPTALINKTSGKTLTTNKDELKAILMKNLWKGKEYVKENRKLTYSKTSDKKSDGETADSKTK